MSKLFRFFVFAFTLCGLAGCDFPKDSRETLAHVKNQTLKVGLIEDPPWVSQATVPSGVEVSLVKDFADSVSAKIEWVHGAEHQLLDKLERGEIHLVIGGLQKDSPYRKQLGFTYSYFKKGEERHVMAVSPGENAFLVELETFLRKNEGRVPSLIARESANP